MEEEEDNDVVYTEQVVYGWNYGITLNNIMYL